jgi:hypothetical protein
LLATARANHLGLRMMFWWSEDRVAAAELSLVAKQQLAARLRAASADKTGDIASLGYFFPGIHYLFIDSPPAMQEAGWVRNNRCTGRQIVLDPREPADDLTQPFRLLHHPPLAIWVHPADTDFAAHLYESPAPPGCVPVMLDKKVQFAFEQVNITRSGIPLGDGYAATDFYI